MTTRERTIGNRQSAIGNASAPVLLFVDALLKGGAERLVVELATRADRERFAPAVACFRQEAFADELAAAQRPVHVVPKKRAFDLGLLFALRRLIRRERVALVHCHDIQSATYGILATRFTRIPIVLTVHGLGIFRQKRARFLMPGIGRWADRVAFVGHWLERAAAEDFGFRPRHPMVVHNGVDVEAFAPGQREPALAAELGIGPGAPVVGTVGNLREVKDYPTLLRGFAVAQARLPDACLVFVGDGPERPGLEALAAELGVAAAVRFAGERSDVARLLRLFSVFALSSKTEGISVALLEAMATGLPAVATDTGGNPEVVTEGETGRLVPVGDPERLGQALADLLADPGRCRVWGQAARRRVQEGFSLQQMISHYERVYDSLACSNAGLKLQIANRKSRMGPDSVTVLTYHAIAPRREDLEGFPPGTRLYVFTIDELCRDLDHLASEGFTTLSMADLVRWHRGEGTLPERPIVVSFDDGHASNAELAAPALSARGQRAIFFVTAGRVGRDETFANWGQLQMMLANGMEIGSHTLTHPFPSSLKPGALEHELAESKRVLEEGLGAPVRFVASPSGYDSRHFARLARQTGYEAALQGDIKRNSRETDLFALGRFVLKRSHGFDLFRRLIDPASRAHVALRRRQKVRNAARRILGVRGYEAVRSFLLGRKAGGKTWL